MIGTWMESTPVIMIQTHRIIQRILKNFITIVTDFSKRKISERNRQQKLKEFVEKDERKEKYWNHKQETILMKNKLQFPEGLPQRSE